MNEAFTDYFNRLNSISCLDGQSRSELFRHITIRNVSKGSFILKYDETCKHIYYVNKGLVRIFYYKNRKDITEWIASENHFLFSIISYFKNEPSKLIIEAIEDSEIILLAKEGLEKLRKTNIQISNLCTEFYSISLIYSQKRMESIQFETAKQRYNNLLSEQPKILNKVPLQYIASYLGITQETLSRIRAKK